MEIGKLSKPLGLLLLLVSVLAQGETSWKPDGYWTGHMVYRGDELVVHVRMEQKDGQVDARLDIPALVYSRQHMDVSFDSDQSLSLGFPFGIGKFNVTARHADQLLGERDGFTLELTRTQAPRHSQQELSFGRPDSRLEGTLYLPEGVGPHPVVVLIAGSGNATRSQWAYASWVDFYLDLGIGAFIYDRRPDLEVLPDQTLVGIDDHAADVMEAIKQIRMLAKVNAGQIGLAGSSRGAWIAMSIGRQMPDLAFLLLSSPAAATPGEQETTSVLTGMRQDGLGVTSLAQARAYLRLYFYVAQTGMGWDLLVSAMANAQGSDWLQYVDQPRTLKDLDWWRANMNFDAVSQLEHITTPLLAMWGGNDFITPWADYQLKLQSALTTAGNSLFKTEVFDGADHRLEVSFGEDERGAWHWFGLAPGALDTIRQFVDHHTQQSTNQN
jgi:pimeloyl-ACP methyl ester carboxylesterase